MSSNSMPKELGIIYRFLHKILGQGKTSKFTEKLVRLHPAPQNLESEYAEMARDEKREDEAIEWAEITFKETTRL
jgi:hypothetical protein